MNRLILTIFLGCLLMFTSPTLNARRRAVFNEKPPKALLVVLKTRQRQVEYMRATKPARMPMLLKDIRGTMWASINDFSVNFSYCPVFYFMDTVADEIKAGHFAGLLLNEKMQPADQTVLKEGDTTFFVADFGYMSEASQVDALAPLATNLNETLIIRDHNFEILKWPRPALAKGFFNAGGNRDNKNWYRSRNFEFDYNPQASAYNRTLVRYYDRR